MTPRSCHLEPFPTRPPHSPPGSCLHCSSGHQCQEPLAKARSEMTGTACRRADWSGRLQAAPTAPDLAGVRQLWPDTTDCFSELICSSNKGEMFFLVAVVRTQGGNA